MLDSPLKALGLGALITLLILLLWVFGAGVDRLGLLSFMLRWLHVFAGMLWIGLVWFVNFIQIVAIAEADDAGKAAILKAIVPRTATAFRHASHVTLLTGILLLVTTGYLLDRWIFTSAVYIPPLRNLMLWGGTIGGLVMWAFVHFVIWPGLQVVLSDASPEAKAAARSRVLTFARANLVLSLPVTFVMVAAAHLY